MRKWLERQNVWVFGYAVGMTVAAAAILPMLSGRSIDPLSVFRRDIDSDFIVYDASAYGQSRPDEKQSPYLSEFESHRRENPGSFESLGRYPEDFPWRKYERSVGMLDLAFWNARPANEGPQALGGGADDRDGIASDIRDDACGAALQFRC